MTQATPPTSVRPELVEGQRSLLDQLAIALACVEDELRAVDKRSMRDWRRDLVLTAAQGLDFGRALHVLAQHELHVSLSAVMRSLVEAFVQFSYLEKEKDKAWKNLALEELQDEHKAMAEGELINVVAEATKQQHRHALDLRISEMVIDGARKLTWEQKMLAVWPTDHKRVYEQYRVLCAESHSRITWFERTYRVDADKRSVMYDPFPVVDHERTQATLEIAIFALIQIAKGLAVFDKAEVPS